MCDCVLQTEIKAWPSAQHFAVFCSASHNLAEQTEHILIHVTAKPISLCWLNVIFRLYTAVALGKREKVGKNKPEAMNWRAAEKGEATSEII